MCVYLTIGNGWGVNEIDNKPFYGMSGYHEALALFEKAIDEHKFASLTAREAYENWTTIVQRIKSECDAAKLDLEEIEFQQSNAD